MNNDFVIYLIIAAIASLVLAVVEAIFPGTFQKLFMGLALFGFAWFWFNN